jgi:hypothetical protein
MGGFFGFDYGPLKTIFTAKRIPENEWGIILDKLNLLTSIAVKYWNKKDETATSPKRR